MRSCSYSARVLGQLPLFSSPSLQTCSNNREIVVEVPVWPNNGNNVFVYPPQKFLLLLISILRANPDIQKIKTRWMAVLDVLPLNKESTDCVFIEINEYNEEVCMYYDKKVIL